MGQLVIGQWSTDSECNLQKRSGDLILFTKRDARRKLM